MFKGNTLTTICLASFLGFSTPLVAPELLTPRSLRSELKNELKGAEADKLAERIREMFGKEDLAKGPRAKTEELTVAWALEAPAAGKHPEVVGVDSSFRKPLERVGTTNVYAAVTDLQEGDAESLRWLWRDYLPESK